MGTSNSNKGTNGRGTPLMPSWLDVDSDVPLPLPSDHPTDETDSEDTISTSTPSIIQPLSLPGNANRFRSARNNFSRFVSSGGKDRNSFGRAVSGYVTRSSGGARQAARSMGSSRVASTRLIGFLTGVVNNGVQQTLRSLKLERFVGAPIEDVFTGLADYICPEGGTVDAGIARDAFIQTIADLTTNGISDLNSLNIDQIQTVFELYATHAIEIRLLNDIGLNTITLSADAIEAQGIQAQLSEFIRNAVSDALTNSHKILEGLTADRVSKFVDTVYEQAFVLLVTLGNKESES